MVFQLRSEHLALASQAVTLVRSPEVQNLRIDIQPIGSTIFRNIHIQYENVSYAVVKVAHGAELCQVARKDHKLLKYIMSGLLDSYKNSKTFLIRVEIGRRIQGSNWKTINLIAGGVNMLCLKIAQSLKHKQEPIVAKRMKSAKNCYKIARRTETI